jgi:exodeoxyribonuclease V beta subunit
VTKNGWIESPLAHLLPGIDPASGTDVDTVLRRFAQFAPNAIEITAPPAILDITPMPTAARDVPLTPKAVQAPRTDFRLMSYSRLARIIGDEVRDVDLPSAFDSMPASVDVIDDGRPRGAAFGTCFHALMEYAVIGELDSDTLARIAQMHGFDAPRERGYLEHLVVSTLNAGLPGGRRLRDLAATDCRAEVEFFVPMRGFSVRSLGEALAPYEFHCRPMEHWPALPNVVQGYLRGFMDLVYRIDERYYVLDYKTNDLGVESSAYASESLRGSIRGHDYDLQYLIYLVALQRLLRNRLGAGYSPESHLGGAVYLFVRGLEHDGGIHFDRPPQLLIDRLESVLCGDRQ